MSSTAVSSKGQGTDRARNLRITWVKSSIGYSRRQKATIRALGFRRLGDSVEHADTAAIQGMIDRIGHLVQVEEIAE